MKCTNIKINASWFAYSFRNFPCGNLFPKWKLYKLVINPNKPLHKHRYLHGYFWYKFLQQTTTAACHIMFTTHFHASLWTHTHYNLIMLHIACVNIMQNTTTTTSFLKKFFSMLVHFRYNPIILILGVIWQNIHKRTTESSSEDVIPHKRGMAKTKTIKTQVWKQ